MAVEGHYNCGSILVLLSFFPPASVISYCSNCRRAGGALCSVNFLVPISDVKIIDEQGLLKSYEGSNTVSENTIARRFCGKCGSPVMTMLDGERRRLLLKLRYLTRF
ncbi:hypothetical protein K469DRAFT_657661 [Zopfia rhizophila CBS 207.26]|uniref:CENP-V/GFA domain-containing protein n=1 Tax=Zopfia rhizophila CBS 207.26 TaxID=1314779 RepID=A0A6A6EJC5_9PEZI|nr:hypothetical protein K469DRAFT_657661 [Zopfia rhizophila CBS 207.26]